MISTDQNMWAKLAGQTDKIESAEIAEIAKTLTRSYVEVASVWIELAGKLREALNVQTNSADASPAPTLQAPTLCIQAAVKVSAKVQMFGTGVVLKLQPLLHADGKTDAITDISFDGSQINIFVPPSAAPGSYNALILSEADLPVGALSLTVPEAPS